MINAKERSHEDLNSLLEVKFAHMLFTPTAVVSTGRFDVDLTLFRTNKNLCQKRAFLVTLSTNFV